MDRQWELEFASAAIRAHSASARLGEDIVARHTNGSIPATEVRKAVDDVVQERRAEAKITETEVTETLDYVDGADTAEQAFERLNERFATISPVAREQLLEDEAVLQVLDDVTVNAAEPLVDPAEGVKPKVVLDEFLWNLGALLPDGVDPDLAAAVLDRARPVFDNLVEANARWEATYGIESDLLYASSLDALGKLSDRVTGARDEQLIVTRLAKLAIHDGIP